MHTTVVRNLDLRPDTPVSFGDGRGGQLTGRIVRVWGRRAINITIKSDDGRTFVRLIDGVTQLPADVTAEVLDAYDRKVKDASGGPDWATLAGQLAACLRHTVALANGAPITHTEVQAEGITAWAAEQDAQRAARRLDGAR